MGCPKRVSQSAGAAEKPAGAAGGGTPSVPGGASPSSVTGGGGTSGGTAAADATMDAPKAAPQPAARIKVTFDGELRRQVVWKPAEKASVVVSDAAVQAGIRVDGGDLVAFTADPAQGRSGRATDPELGAGEETVAVGVATRDGVRVAREVRAFVPDSQPDVVVMRSTFRNAGEKRVHVDRVTAERVLLDRAQAEPGQAPHAFVSYQGAATTWGKDYTVVPIAPGFRRTNFMGQDDPQGPEGIGGGMPLVDRGAKPWAWRSRTSKRAPAGCRCPSRCAATGAWKSR
jgi:hypothetical protein